MDSMSRLLKLAQNRRHIQESLEIIEEALAKYKLDQTCISFNGGKDCTAVLHLVHSIARKLSQDNDQVNLMAFYSQLPNHFEEEAKFVRETVKRYNLKLMQYSLDGSLKESLGAFKKDMPNVEAIFIGTRRDDFKPGTQMDPMAPTNNGWPKFMRINPIINWSYSQVWEFIRELDIPYCDLYNQGYSSLGTRSDTTRNSSLLRYDEHGKAHYMPAWHLTSSKEERLSRSSSMDTSALVRNEQLPSGRNEQ